jgi:hypothetical protein
MMRYDSFPAQEFKRTLPEASTPTEFSIDILGSKPALHASCADVLRLQHRAAAA